jgi:hypothetical protein
MRGGGGTEDSTIRTRKARLLTPRTPGPYNARPGRSAVTGVLTQGTPAQLWPPAPAPRGSRRHWSRGGRPAAVVSGRPATPSDVPAAALAAGCRGGPSGTLRLPSLGESEASQESPGVEHGGKPHSSSVDRPSQGCRASPVADLQHTRHLSRRPDRPPLSRTLRSQLGPERARRAKQEVPPPPWRHQRRAHRTRLERLEEAGVQTVAGAGGIPAAVAGPYGALFPEGPGAIAISRVRKNGKWSTGTRLKER